MRIKFLLSFVVGFLFTMVAYGQTVTWTGAVNSNIRNASNWTTNTLPNNTISGIINACIGCLNPVPTVPINNPTFANNTIITIQSGGNINLNNNTLRLGTLNINNSLTFTQGGITANTININSKRSPFKEYIIN